MVQWTTNWKNWHHTVYHIFTKAKETSELLIHLLPVVGDEDSDYQVPHNFRFRRLTVHWHSRQPEHLQGETPSFPPTTVVDESNLPDVVGLLKVRGGLDVLVATAATPKEERKEKKEPEEAGDFSKLWERRPRIFIAISAAISFCLGVLLSLCMIWCTGNRHLIRGICRGILLEWSGDGDGL